MPIDWKTAENKERLLACLFASIEDSGNKVNYKRIAELFGQGTTGNAIECNFRKIRAQSKEVRKEWESGMTSQVPAATPNASPRKPKTPKKDSFSAVKSGRIEKPLTPSKKPIAAIVKTEEMPTPPAETSFLGMSSFDSVYGGHMGMSYTHSFDDEI